MVTIFDLLILSECVSKFVYFVYLQLLQNLGKVDRTADEIFDEHLNNFQRQQNSASRLQKEFNNYIRCIRGLFLNNKTIIYDDHYMTRIKYGVDY